MSGSHLINKSLFEAGTQCAKRLYLAAHHADDQPQRSDRSRELSEIGEHLVELASQAFPKGKSVAELDTTAAIEKTTAFLEEGNPGVLFGAAFRGGNAETRTDIVLISPEGDLDIFEVKAGTTVKPRHVLDVALQIYAIEACGHKVKSASILHLNPKYRHKGGKIHPVQQLFKNVDVTDKARRQVPRVGEQIASFQTLLEDQGSLDLPTGTWCNNPLPCPYLGRCLEQGPEFPLIHLPQLKPEQENQLHERAIEDLSGLENDAVSLTPQQQRVLASVRSGKILVEDFVPGELRDVDYPLGFTHIQWYLEVLPRLEQGRPWQKLPYMWSMQVVHEDGRSEVADFVSETPDDPRESCLKSLTKELREIGTMIIYGRGLDERLRSMLEDLPDLKPDLRALLQAPLLELGNLITHGVYHPGFAGSFDLPVVYAALIGEADDDLEIRTDEDADRAYRRLLNSRTRAKTRTTLADQLRAYAKSRSDAMLQLYRLLLDAPG